MTGRTPPADTVGIALADGRQVQAPAAFADRVVGVDADDDLLIPLGEPGRPIYRADGSEYLVPLTPCCYATGKGSIGCEGPVCRGCYYEVDDKYGMHGTLSVARAQPG
ncbi:hypothetical protein [Amycolatopsis sp. NPDC004079]|uniref:hypothetical protein n=1 Tax=Amycolatopsis sp. NPDC004079 TaxID=3154549 RepID=UPI0033BCA144